MTNANEIIDIFEKVYGKLATVYTRRRRDLTLKKIEQEGFRAGSGAMYGKAIYTCYDFRSQQREGMIESYGPYIVKSKVNLDKFFICDPWAAKKVYGKKYYTLSDQAEYILGKDLSEDDFLELVDLESMIKSEKGGYTSEVALKLSHSKFKKICRGLVFTGRHDGRVAVVYNQEAITPISYTYAPEESFKLKENEMEWISVKNKALIAKALSIQLDDIQKATSTEFQPTEEVVQSFIKRKTMLQDVAEEVIIFLEGSDDYVITVGYGDLVYKIVSEFIEEYIRTHSRTDKLKEVKWTKKTGWLEFDLSAWYPNLKSIRGRLDNYHPDISAVFDNEKKLENLVNGPWQNVLFHEFEYGSGSYHSGAFDIRPKFGTKGKKWITDVQKVTIRPSIIKLRPLVNKFLKSYKYNPNHFKFDLQARYPEDEFTKIVVNGLKDYFIKSNQDEIKDCWKLSPFAINGLARILNFLSYEYEKELSPEVMVDVIKQTWDNAHPK